MKILYIALGLFVIIGIGLLVTEPKDAVRTESTVTEETTKEPSPMPMMETNEHGMTAEEHAAMMGESPAGTDVGMEMPMQTVSNIEQNSPMKMFDIVGTDFAYDVKEIRLKEGDPVMIHFKSGNGFHDFVIDEFNVQSEKIRTGGMAMITFVADKKGTFEYYCSVGTHREKGMVGKLIVE